MEHIVGEESEFCTPIPEAVHAAFKEFRARVNAETSSRVGRNLLDYCQLLSARMRELGGVTYEANTLDHKRRKRSHTPWQQGQAAAFAKAVGKEFTALFGPCMPRRAEGAAFAVATLSSGTNESKAAHGAAMPSHRGGTALNGLGFDEVMRSLKGLWLEVIWAAGEEVRYSISWFTHRYGEWLFSGYSYHANGDAAKAWTGETLARCGHTLRYTYGQAECYPGFGLIYLNPIGDDVWDAVSGLFIEVQSGLVSHGTAGALHPQILPKIHFTTMYRLDDALRRAGTALSNYPASETWTRPADFEPLIRHLIEKQPRWGMEGIPESVRPRAAGPAAGVESLPKRK